MSMIVKRNFQSARVKRMRPLKPMGLLVPVNLLMHAHQPKIYNGQAMPFYNNLYYPIDQESDISLNVTFVVDAGTTDLTGREESSSN